MNILRFINWWWNKKNSHEKITFSIVTWTILLIPNLIIFGIKGFLIYFGILLLVGAFLAIQGVYRSLNKQWREFREERDREAQHIVDILSGKPELSDTHEMLRKLRIRAGKPPR